MDTSSLPGHKAWGMMDQPTLLPQTSPLLVGPQPWLPAEPYNTTAGASLATATSSHFPDASFHGHSNQGHGAAWGESSVLPMYSYPSANVMTGGTREEEEKKKKKKGKRNSGQQEGWTHHHHYHHHQQQQTMNGAGSHYNDGDTAGKTELERERIRLINNATGSVNGEINNLSGIFNATIQTLGQIEARGGDTIQERMLSLIGHDLERWGMQPSAPQL